MKKRVLSLTLCLCLLLSLLPVAAAADFAGGSGTAEDPYQIATPSQLKAFRDDVNGGNDYWGKTFILTADIDLGRGDWTPIGTFDKPFRGTFDGGGHEITGFCINSGADNQGLFGRVDWSGTVKNLGVSGTATSSGNVSHMGGVVGLNYGTVENCHYSGTVWGHADVGGVVGNNSGTVENCYTIDTVWGRSYVGGVVGNNSGTVKNCYNTSPVMETPGGGGYVGGVVGWNNGTVENCYNTGTVSGNTDIGGVVGWNNDTVKNCYYRADRVSGGIGGSDVPGQADGLSDDAFKVSGSFTSWDFTTVWKMSVTLDRPILRSNPEAVEIATRSELKAFRDAVNGGKSYAGKTVTLTDEIDLDGSETDQWTPIGTSSNNFKGTFEGGGHEITGLYINNAAEDQGLFGYVEEGGTVKNLGVSGTVTTTGWYAGAWSDRISAP